MASARKKLDEKNLKILRELVSKSENKYCFDCHQRGPTYVNVTIGSFVCTSCSGLLRGLRRPPHRVKSISMATFTPEEIEQLKSQGNEYCSKIWLGLCDNDTPVIPPKDEQQMIEFLTNKYERKRYYLKPDDNNVAVNGTSRSTPMNNQKLTSSVTFPTIPSYNSVTNNSSHNRNSTTFSPDSFSKKEVNSSLDSFNLDKFNGEDTNSSTIANFANFDNNPVFSSPTSNTFSGAINTSENIPPPPSEDRYAALKDLDCLMKSQLLASTTPSTDNVTEMSSKNEWNENNVVWPSSSSSVFEQTLESEAISEKTSNPFVRSENGWNGTFEGNPFKTDNIWNCHANGLPTSQSMNYISSGSVWDTSQLRNPFFVSNSGQNTTHHSSNPFL